MNGDEPLKSRGYDFANIFGEFAKTVG